MSAIDEAVRDVMRGLMQLADELRAVGLAEPAGRCDAMSQRLSRAVQDSMAETQPIDPEDLER